jgi:hypothetical protein
MRWLILAYLLCFTAFLAGCGGSDAPATAGAGAPPPPGAAPPPPGDGGAGDSGTPMDGTEGNPQDGSQPQGSDSGEPMTPPDAAQTGDATATTDSPDSTTPTPDPNADPNQSGELNPDGTPREPAKPKTLRDQAIAAFSEGDDAQARRLLNAHFVVVPAAKDELAKKMAWFPGLARPALGPRIGIAVQYSDASRDFRGNPMPIGSAELTSAVQQAGSAGDSGGESPRRSRRSRDSGGGGGGDSSLGSGNPSPAAETIASASGMEQLRFYTGEFGEILLETLQERFTAGEYGAVPKELLEEASRRRRESEDPNNPGDPGSSLSTPDAGLASPQPEGATPGSARARRRTAKTASQDSASAAEHVKQLTPGILWLGKADERDQVTKRAEVAGVDILAVFEISVAVRGDFARNTTKLRLLSMKQGYPVVADHKGEPLVNLTVEQWRQKEQKGADPVDREVDKAIEALDKVLKPAPLPEALTAERAKKRIADLVAQKPDDPLPVLVEARFYVSKGLLPEDDFKSSAIALLGQSGYAELQEKGKIGME